MKYVLKNSKEPNKRIKLEWYRKYGGIELAFSNNLSREIDVYIKQHQDSYVNRFLPVEISGKREDLLVYRFPTELLRYNIRNGRFAAEYAALVSKQGRELDPNNKKDSSELRKLLLTLNPKQTEILKADLIRIGQLEPGIITFDGYVINGNRRMAIFELLSEETGEPRWSYIEMALLPHSVSEKDLWRLEANLQFSRDEKVDYGPINTLLKFREGIKAGLSSKQIAASMFGGFKEREIIDSLERLKLIDNYLEYIGKKNDYVFAEGINEHFIDLSKFISKQRKNGLDALELNKMTKIAFDMIKTRKLRHLDLRDLNIVAENAKAKEHLLNSEDELKGEETSIKATTGNNYMESKENTNTDVFQKEEEESEDLDDEPSRGYLDPPALVVFQESVEIAKATQAQNQPIKLLNKALANLQNVVLDTSNRMDPKTLQIIEEINSIVKKLLDSTKP